MNLTYMLWIGMGFIGAYILNRNPGKLEFGRTFHGSMMRSALAVIVLVSVMSGPFLLILALLLPTKKLCPSCFFAVRVEETICPNCSAFVPDAKQEIGSAEEKITESQISHFSPEIQAVIVKGQKDVSLISGILLIGTLVLSLIFGVFIIENPIIIFGGMILGFVLGWLWWSYSVPRWRDWALKQPGVNPDDLQKAAEIASLVWPKGHFFEKTEFKTKKQK